MKVVMLIGLLSLSACGTTANVSSDYLTMTGTPEGWRAGMDGMRSLITEGKASADTTSAAWQFRAAEESEITNRAANRKSLFGGLFSSQKEQTK